MNDPGLYTALYAQLRAYAELIDDVIVDLETAGTTGAAARRRALGSLLRALDTAPASDASAVLLWNLLRENQAQRRSDWREIANAIERGDASGVVIGRLEELARVLEVERAEMHARMYGSNAR